MPPQHRDDPYVQNGEAAFLIPNGGVHFRQIKSDHHSGGGSFQFDFVGETGKPSCCGWAYPFLVSNHDMAWFKSVVARTGATNREVWGAAVQGDLEATYLLCWLEAAHQSNIYARSRDSKLMYFDRDSFLRAVQQVVLN